MNTAFNPGLIDVTNLSARAVQRLGHADDIDHQPRLHPMVAVLEQAAARFDARRDSFAQGKGATCRDIAAKLQRFGSFASDRQAEFAAKLVEWSKPRDWNAAASRQDAPGSTIAAPAAPTPAPRPVVRLEKFGA